MTDSSMTFVLIMALAVVALLRGVYVVPLSTAFIVERLGKYTRTLDSGVHVIVPFVDRVRAKIDLKEQALEVSAAVRTADNVEMTTDTVVYYQVTDAKSAMYQVADLKHEIEQLTAATLRDMVAAMDAGEAPSLDHRPRINDRLSAVLTRAAAAWGTRIYRADLRTIEPSHLLPTAGDASPAGDTADHARHRTLRRGADLQPGGRHTGRRRH